MLLSSEMRAQFILSMSHRIGTTAAISAADGVQKSRHFSTVPCTLLWSCFVLPSHYPAFHCWSETAVLPPTVVTCLAATCGFVLEGEETVWEPRTHLLRVHGHGPHLPEQHQSRSLALETRSPSSGSKGWPKSCQDSWRREIPEVLPKRKCSQKEHCIVGNVVPSEKLPQRSLTAASVGA